MKTYLLESALLPQGWAENVAMTVDAAGDIAAIGPGMEADAAVRVTGCVVPGMPNLHSHAHQRAMVGLAERASGRGDSFWSWRQAMYAYVGKIQPGQLQALAAQVYVEMLKFGYTSVAEFQYLHHDPAGTAYDNPAEMSLRCYQAAQTAGIGITLLPVLYNYSGFGGLPAASEQRRFTNDADAFLQIVVELQQATAPDRNAAVGIAPHSLRAVTPGLLDEVLAAYADAGPVHIHIAEQTAEVEACVQWSGARPVQWLLANQPVNADWCLVHATHMTTGECAGLADSGAVAGICPSTEANLGDGIFPSADYLSQGGRLGIGSDSQVCINPAEELRWLEYAQRLSRQGRNILAAGAGASTGRSLIDAVVAGGSQVSGRKLGGLAAGRRADFVVLDNRHPRLMEREGDALLDSWIFASDSNPVRDVYVGGRQVVCAGRHMNEQSVAREFQRALADLRLA